MVGALEDDRLAALVGLLVDETLPALRDFVEAVERGSTPPPAKACAVLARLAALDTGLRQFLEAARPPTGGGAG